MKRWRHRYLVILCGLVLGGLMATGLSAPRVLAQHPTHSSSISDDDAAQAFGERVREALAPFADRDRAIAAGYRQVGPDFPGMGEHWVHPRLIFSNAVDATAPPVLSYVELDGRAVLTGAAFAVPLSGDADPPKLPFGDVWHVHEGSVDEETLVLNPGVRIRGTESSTRLAMFHVWTELDNPEGMFSQDNWRLPFVRLGLPAPENVSPEAAKAVFLLEGGVAYYLRLIDLAASPSDDEMMRFEDVLSAAAGRVRTCVENVRPDAPDVGGLETIWSDIGVELGAAARPGTRSTLAELFDGR